MCLKLNSRSITPHHVFEVALPHSDPELLEHDHRLPPGAAAVAVQDAAHGGLLTVGHVVTQLGHAAQRLHSVAGPQNSANVLGDTSLW